MSRTAALLRSAAAALPHVVVDLVGCAGICAVSYGAYEIYRPAGFITCGALLIIASLGLARR